MAGRRANSQMHCRPPKYVTDSAVVTASLTALWRITLKRYILRTVHFL